MLTLSVIVVLGVAALVAGFCGAGIGALVWLALGAPGLDDE